MAGFPVITHLDRMGPEMPCYVKRKMRGTKECDVRQHVHGDLPYSTAVKKQENCCEYSFAPLVTTAQLQVESEGNQ